MARMIPDRLRTDTRSPAERRLYLALRDQLPDDFTVFHQVSWQVRDVRGGARDGEADFVIAHPLLGILVLEVKGGAIRHDGFAGQWYSNEFAIKDPFAQARGSKYSLLSRLQEHPYWRQRRITIGHAVAFPDVAVNAKLLRPDASADIVLDGMQMGDLAGWVRTAFRHYHDVARDSMLGAPGMADLERLLSPSIELKPLLGIEIEEEGQELIRLTEQQFWVLDFLGRHRRAAISGCAGSGKTLLATEKARRLSQQGFRVLLTCYNRNLADFLRASLAHEERLQVMHFHGLCRQLAHLAGLHDHDDRSHGEDYFDETLPGLLVNAAAQLNWHVDAVIVDEGQDFQSTYWPAIECVLDDPRDGILYVFYDDNQNLYDGTEKLPVETLPYPLTVNCRNTQSIHSFVRQFYRSDHTTTASGPAGRPVDWIDYATPAELKRQLSVLLHRLVVEGRVPIDDIVLLTPRARDHSILWKLGQLGNFRLVDRPGASGEILCTTIHQFKGLESPVVILVEVEPHTSQDLTKLLYVGASRARNHLTILARNG
ncbi:MAG: ATP-binding domain-containing protein [Chloroflexi bacterium]|nr:ATP-binding domain-containing protein [Chloroflexota bacterium]